MKTLSLSIIFLLFVYTCFAKQPLMFQQLQNGFVKIIEADHKKFIISSNGIWMIEKKKLVQQSSFTFNCNAATQYNNQIALATNEGIKIFDITKNAIANFLSEKITGNINSIETDQQNGIWFTKEFEGCFFIDGDNVFQRLKVPVTYCMAKTNDSSIWVGTNIGLYKIPINGGEILRFAEEGIASYDLPDNLVEKLYSDSKSNVWALMPEHLSFISSADLNSEFPDYEYLGKKENELYNVAEVPQSNQAYLFSTSEGIIYIPDLKAGELMRIGEIHQTIKEKAFLLTDEVIQRPLQFKDEKVKAVVNIGSETFFITARGVWSVSSKKFVSRLQKQFISKA